MEAELKEILTRIENRLDRVEEETRHTRILLEGQRGDIRQLAEGIIGSNERLDAFSSDVKEQFELVRSLISTSHLSTDRRLKLLESWKERTDRDPVEIVRERFGRPKAT